jgi:hypothetical protein
MNDDDIRASIRQGQEWTQQELDAYVNASNWLWAAAQGLTPQGDVSCRTAHSADNPSNQATMSPPPTPESITTMTATSTAADSAGTVISTPPVKETQPADPITFDGPDMMPWENGNE